MVMERVSMRVASAAVLLFVVLGEERSHSAVAKPAWQAEWERVIAAAHQEGEITIYGQARHPVSAAIRAFEQAYPKVRLNFLGGTGAQLGVRVMAEKRAGKHLVDLAIGGAGTQVEVYARAGLLEPLSSAFILPDVADPSLWWEKKHHYADPENRTVFMIVGNASSSIGAYNTNLVKRGEIQSWWDLLQPKWKGRIVMTDARSAGNIGSWRYLYYSPDLGPKFIRRLLGEMDVTFSSDERQMMDWLGTGKKAIHLLAKGANIDKAKEQGLPVEDLTSQKEGGSISTGSNHLSFFKNAPHPNAARVYINWALSREGQLTWQKITQDNSLRADISKETVLPENILREGANYIMTSHPQYEDVRPLRKLVDEVLTDAKRK